MAKLALVFIITLLIAFAFSEVRVHTIDSLLNVTANGSTRTSTAAMVIPRWEPLHTADVKEFEDARCKGERFLTAMKGSDFEAGKIFASQADPPTMRSAWQGDLKRTFEPESLMIVEFY
jgi:hypothetical protein